MTLQTSKQDETGTTEIPTFVDGMQLAELFIYSPRGSWVCLFISHLHFQSLVPMGLPVLPGAFRGLESKKPFWFWVKTVSVPLCTRLLRLTDTGRRRMRGKTIFLNSSPALNWNTEWPWLQHQWTWLGQRAVAGPTGSGWTSASVCPALAFQFCPEYKASARDTHPRPSQTFISLHYKYSTM